MRRIALAITFALLLVNAGFSGSPADWAMNATVIEACSCPMFCQCYFNTKPAAHHDHGSSEAKHYCKFNNAYKINKGHYGNVKLDNAKFWITGDLGDDFSTGTMERATVIFDKSVTKQQRDALVEISQQLFPVKWKSLNVAEGNIDKWEYTKDVAHATLDGGKTAEVKLKRADVGNTSEPTVMKNLRYWGAQHNDGFVMMPNEVNAYRGETNAFEFKGTNGFMVTFDISSKKGAATASAKY